MKTLKESILSSTKSGRFGMDDRIRNGDFNAQLVKMLEKEVAIFKVKEVSELKTTIGAYIKAAGNNCHLNWIDTSEITSMNSLFAEYKLYKFNGDISKWNVSNVTDMYFMFAGSKFNGNISKWDVSKVVNMCGMFNNSDFNGNISDWDTSNAIDMTNMFYYSEFNGNISKWNVSNVKYMDDMFSGSDFNQDISNWDVKNVKSHRAIFNSCPIKPEYKPKFK